MDVAIWRWLLLCWLPVVCLLTVLFWIFCRVLLVGTMIWPHAGSSIVFCCWPFLVWPLCYPWYFFGSDLGFHLQGRVLALCAWLLGRFSWLVAAELVVVCEWFCGRLSWTTLWPCGSPFSGICMTATGSTEKFYYAQPLLLTLLLTLVFLSSCILVRYPTPLRRIFSMATTDSCAAGREMPRTSKQPILYTW